MTPNNIGVPGIRLADIKTAGYGFNNDKGFNPYFERMLSGSNVGASYLQYISQSKPTFFSNWLGNNDVLGFATSGGDLNNDGITDYVGMTDAGLFTSLYTELLDTLTSGKKRKGVVATVPYVTSIPFFTTVTSAAVLKSAPAGSKLYVKTDAGSRTIKAQDLICLTTQSVIGRIDSIVVSPTGAKAAIPHGFHPLNPLTNKEVLDSAEVSEVRKRVDAFNSTIKTKAAEYDLAVFDANPYLEKVKTGVAIDGISLNAAFISGGAFSLDGVHLTPRGYALIANQFITAINAKYGSTLSPVNLSAYPAVAFPK
jgi:hypothetical protein